MLLKKINRLYYIKNGVEVNIPHEKEDSELYYLPREADKDTLVIKELQDGTTAKFIRSKNVFIANDIFKVLTIAMCFLYLLS